jgi:hypothetical protein
MHTSEQAAPSRYDRPSRYAKLKLALYSNWPIVTRDELIPKALHARLARRRYKRLNGRIDSYRN